MSATDFDIAAWALPTNSESNQQASAINPSISYNIQGNTNVQTLSAKNPNNYDAIQGLLYAPAIFNSSSCSNTTMAVFPSNITTLTDIPNLNYPLMSIFPWTTSECVQAFLAASRADAVRGALVFQPNSGPNVPPGGSPIWSIGDNGQWLNDNQYPVYAISAQMAAQVLGAMSQYSGSNLTQAPFGDQLTHTFSSSFVARLLLKVDLVGSNVPSLWTFLIIVLAVLLGLVIIASFIMHLFQRRQRHVLQRRLARGEVDLESLGIKKMNVPQEEIDKMPSFVYKAKSETEESDEPVKPAPVLLNPPNKDKLSTEARDTSYSQNTCAICLDDFVDNETMIRELPCKHIFHPECIDPFLRDNSSLCPLCKKSALPAGYCPVRVTNIMVRRERLVRRMRERRRRNMAALTGTPMPVPWRERAVLAVKRFFRVGEGIAGVSAPREVSRRWQTNGTDLEMATNNTLVEDRARPAQTEGQTDETGTNVEDLRQQQSRRDTEMPENIARQGTAARRAWRRERLARQQEQNYTEQAEAARREDEGRSVWRRGMDRMFPGAG